MEKYKYSLGLDLGVASIGWGCVLLDDNDMPTRILDNGSVIFTSLDNDKGQLYNVNRRDARGTRRVLRRKKERIRRVRSLLVNSNIISREDLQSIFHDEGKTQPLNIFDVRIKGIDNKLTNEELSRVLINYCKNRGFKSNRKHVSQGGDEGKMKSAIATIKNEMDSHKLYPSQAIVKYFNENQDKVDSFHNSGDNYVYGVDRAEMQKEIECVLDTQIKHKVINEDFKKEYLDIWTSQRDFSEGPASGPYRVDFESAFGFCSYRKDEKRASRACPSFEINNLLSKLYNLRYFIVLEDGSYELDEKGKRRAKKELSLDQIKKVYEQAIDNGKIIKYSDIIKICGIDNCVIDNLPKLSKTEYNTLLIEFKDKNNIEGRVEDDKLVEFNEIVKKNVLSKVFFDAKSLKSLKKSSKDRDFKIEELDQIATILSYAQTDAKIEQLIKEKNEFNFSLEDIELIKTIDMSNPGPGSLCVSLLQDLNKEMLLGNKPDIALLNLGFKLGDEISKEVKFTKAFPSVDEIEEYFSTKITQPNVRHMLSIFRKFYIELVKKYGEPTFIHIELARDIANDFSTRNTISRDNINNQVQNQNAMIALANTELGKNRIKTQHYHSLSSDDVIRYRLWIDQDKKCMYSNREILESDLFTNSLEVDHILPFSRTFDNTYNNKALVYRTENQDKQNRTPYEWLKNIDGRWDAFASAVKNMPNLSSKKVEKLLLTDEINNEEFTNQSLHATSYMSKLVARIFREITKDKDEVKVRTFKGSLTSYLRKYYRLNHLTHSLQNEEYDRNKTEYYCVQKVKDKDTKLEIDQVTYELKADDIEASSITLKCQNEYGAEFSYTLNARYSKKYKRFFSVMDEELALTLKNNKVLLNDIFLELFIVDDKPVNIFSINDQTIIDVVSKTGKMELFGIVIKLLTGLKADINSKNRENHFHHEVDALLIATMTKSIEQRITKFHQLMQSYSGSNGKEGIYTDPDTGEVFTKEKIMETFNIDNKNNKLSLWKDIPLPYSDFVKELTYRVFERDEVTLRNRLLQLSNYTEELVKEVNVKYPYHYADKRVSGALHKETILAKRKELGKDILVKKVSVSELKENNIDKIFDKDGSQKEIYKAVSEWMKLKADKPKYPTLKNGNTIKKVKVHALDIDKSIQISPNDESKGFAQNGDIARIEIYIKENDDKLYFVHIPIALYLKQKNKDYDFNVTVWWGQGNNNKIINYKSLNALGYTKKVVLYPGQIVNVETKNGSGVAKTIGFSSGKFEVKSIIGDDFDFIKTGLSSKVNSRIRLTISTIQDINIITQKILGIYRGL